MRKRLRKRKFFLFISSLIVVVLVVSFGFHSAQIAHEHPVHGAHASEHAHGGEEPSGGTATVLFLGEHMHAAEKKLFLLLIAAGALTFLICTKRWRSLIAQSFLLNRRHLFIATDNSRRITSYLQSYASKGLLNPKPY